MGCRYLSFVAAEIACSAMSVLHAQAVDTLPTKGSESSAAGVPFRHDVIALAAQKNGVTDFATGSVFKFRDAACRVQRGRGDRGGSQPKSDPAWRDHPEHRRPERGAVLSRSPQRSPLPFYQGSTKRVSSLERKSYDPVCLY